MVKITITNFKYKIIGLIVKGGCILLPGHLSCQVLDMWHARVAAAAMQVRGAVLVAAAGAVLLLLLAAGVIGRGSAASGGSVYAAGSGQHCI